MQKGKEVSLKYSMEGTDYYIYMLPVGLENGWYVSCMLPADVLSEQYREIRGLSVSLLIENGTALAIVALLAVFILYRSSHRMQGMKRELELIAANIPGGVFSYTADEKERFCFISNGLLEMVGYTEKEFRRMTDNRFSQMILEPDRERVLKEIDGQIAENGKNDQVEYRIRTKDGRVLWVDDRGQYVTDKLGKSWFYVVILDITEKKEIQEKIKRKEECLRLVLEKSDNIILELDFATDTAYFSDSVKQRIGIPPVIHNYCRNFGTRKNIHAMDNQQFMNLILQIKSGLSYGEAISRFKLQQTGEYAWFKICILAITDENGAVTGGFAIGVDIDREMKENASLKQLAERDSLTGAFNKGSAETMVSRALRDAKQQKQAFIMIDIDNFKNINDTHGHMAGDFALKTIVERMGAYMGQNVIVGRVGGDELMVFMKNVMGRKRVEQTILEMMERLQEPVNYHKQKIIISVSVGIAMYPQDGESYHELFDRADEALYQAKDAGKNRYKFYND